MSETPVCPICGVDCPCGAVALPVLGLCAACHDRTPASALIVLARQDAALELARAALSAAEKERASAAGVIRNGIIALREIAKIEAEPGKKKALQILALGFVVLADSMEETRAPKEASAASEAQPPPEATLVPGAQEGEK